MGLSIAMDFKGFCNVEKWVRIVKVEVGELGPGEKVFSIYKSGGGPSKVRDGVKDIKSDDQVFSCKFGSKNLVLDCKGWEDLNVNGFADFGDFKVSAIGGFEILGNKLPM